MSDQLYRLAHGVLLFPAEELPPAVRTTLAARPGQYAITHRGARSTTKLVDGETAALLRRFDDPKPLVGAVIEFSEARQSDPRTVLELAFPILRQLVADGILAPAETGADAADEERPERIGPFEIDGFVQRLPDFALLRGHAPDGHPVAIKLLRDRDGPVARATLRREAAVLARAAGCAVPALLADATDGEDEAFIALEWIDGVRLADYATRRRPWTPDATHLAAAIQMLDAYAGLHERGIVHGDVHPKNVLVDGSGSVTLVDFGFARVPGDPELDAVPRGGLPGYFEPEWAAARLSSRRAPRAGMAGEQYSVGALVYFALTGHHYVEAVGDVAELLRRIVAQAPLPFGEHGLPPRPAVEEVLRRMLAKAPADRFPSLAAAADAMRAARDAERAAGPGTTRPAVRPQLLLDTTVGRLSRSGGAIDRGLATAPRVSVNYGAAGIAYLFYRLALQHEDPGHLLTATRWIAWAHRQSDDPDAYVNQQLDLRADRVGRVSIYHSAAGTACVEALVANAMGDMRRAERALAGFAAASRNVCASLDLTIGRTSTLVGATLLVEALRGTGLPERANLLQLGDETLAAVFARAGTSIGGERSMRLRGVAHGWAGLLYAALRWCEATGARVPAAVTDRLVELAALGRVVDGYVTWRGPDDLPMAGGWCHGPAGYVQLWSAAARVLGDETYSTLALRAAETSWAGRERAATLCCGLAGQSHSMLVAHRVSGEERWVARAKDLAEEAVTHVGTGWCLPNSLYKGDVGIALLVSDLEQPGQASMPLFAPEGWPVPARDAERAISGVA